MNLFQLVIKQMRQRALGTWLTLLSVTLGVGLAITILVLYREAGNLFGQKDYGYDVLLGKQGSGTQLVMNSVYHVDKSPGNISYQVYEEMLDPERLPTACVPVVLGDHFMGPGGVTPIVATTTDLFGLDDETHKPLDRKATIQYSPGQYYEFAEGRCFAPNKFEAVVGSDAAKDNSLKIGSEFSTADCNATGMNAPPKWVVVGILKPTSSNSDNAIFTPVRSFYAVQKHAEEMRADWVRVEGEPATEPASGPTTTPTTQASSASFRTEPDGTFTATLPRSMWEISAILVKSGKHVDKLIDIITGRRPGIQAVQPVAVMKEAGNPMGPVDLGYNLVVGKTGPALQLVKSSAYHIGKPIGFIPYQVYEDILTMEPAAVAPPSTQPVAEGAPVTDVAMNFYDKAKIAVPIVVGDTYKGIYRIVGTTTNMFGIDDDTGKPTDPEHTFEYRLDRHYEFADGRCFVPNKFEAILGYETARKSGLKMGSVFQATHGEGMSTNPDIHKQKWTVVGVLKKTFTANDNCVFIPLKTDYCIEDHELGIKQQWLLKHGGTAPPPNTDPDDVDIYRTHADGTFDLFMPKAVWEVSAVFVKARGDEPMGLMYDINNRNEAMAVNPADVMRQFFDNFLKIPTQLLLVVACLVSIVAAVGILVSIYNSVSARMREIAIMRALGATRKRILVLICVEAGLVGLFGGVLGLIVGHAMGGVASYIFTLWVGRGINWYVVDLYEVYYLLAVIVVALLAGLVPAMKAYSTPVATNLVVV
jgi:putative ABC transport system permease protein